MFMLNSPKICNNWNNSGNSNGISQLVTYNVEAAQNLQLSVLSRIYS